MNGEKLNLVSSRLSQINTVSLSPQAIVLESNMNSCSWM